MKNTTIKMIVYCFKLMYSSSKMAFICNMVVNSIVSLYVLFNVNMLKYIIDMLLDNQINKSQIYFMVVVYIISLVLIETLYGIKNVLWNYTYDKARNKFLEWEYYKVINMPMAYVDTKEGRDEIDYVMGMVDQIANIAYDILDVGFVFVKFSIVVSTLIEFDTKFTLFVLVLIIPSIICDLFNTKKIDCLKHEKASDERKIKYYRWMLTDIKPAKDVRMYNLTDALKKRYEDEKNSFLNDYKKNDKHYMTISICSEFIKYGGEILFSIYVIIQTVKTNITVGEMTLYISYIAIASSSFLHLFRYACNIIFNFKKQMERVFKFNNLPSDLELNKGKYKLEDFQSLRFENVYFRYPTSNEYVLRGVNFTINKGDRISLVGINGAGKSTIIKIILGLYAIESGCIYINEHPINEYDVRDIRKIFSVLFQSYGQYAFTLKENIGLSDLDRIDCYDDMVAAMKKSGVYSFFNKFPNGLESYVTKEFDDNGVELSQGQKQQLALCRTYFKKSQIVIFDEPSASLDAEIENKIFSDFFKISHDKTAIVVSHRISCSRLANKIIVLDKGKVAEIGTHDELINIENGIYSKLYTLQKRKYNV